MATNGTKIQTLIDKTLPKNNYRFSNTNPQKHRGRTRVLKKGPPFFFTCDTCHVMGKQQEQHVILKSCWTLVYANKYK